MQMSMSSAVPSLMELELELFFDGKMQMQNDDADADWRTGRKQNETKGWDFFELICFCGG
jgi:hypothetical protein